MKLIDYIQQNGIKQNWLARQADLTPSRLNVIAKGRIDPRLDEIRKIEKATGGKVTAADFMEKDGE